MAIIGLVIILLGVALWMGGRRGKTIGNHPYCKKCHFDLYALPLETRRCPECGADIFADNAICVGHQRSLVSLMLAGGIFSFGGAVLVGWAALAWWPHFDGSPYKPAAWLERDIASHDLQKRRRACSELERRIAAGSLVKEQLNLVAQTVLRLQADPALQWNPHWGDLLQKAQTSDHRLPPALWQQYVSQALSITAEVRPHVRLGDPVPIRLTCRLRAGTDFAGLENITVAPSIQLDLEKISGLVEAPPRGMAPLSSDESASSSLLQWNLFWMPGHAEGQGPSLPDSLAGPHVLRLTAALRATESAAPLALCRQTFSIPFQLLASTQGSVRLVHAADQATREAQDALQTEVAHSIRLSGTQADPAAPATVPFVFEQRHTLGNLWISCPPVCLSFSVVLRQHAKNGGTREWSLARLMVRPNDAVYIPLRMDMRTFDERPDDGPAEIVCIPDSAPAAGTVDIQEVWGDPVTMPINLQIGDF